MASYSRHSQAQLDTCHEDLRLLFNEVIKEFDCSILEGNRNEKRQNELYRSNKSQVQYPNSKHNSLPSNAVDAAPYPIDWSDRERFSYFAGYVKAKAESLGIRIRWGGDWDGDWQVRDNNFDDLAHFELIN